MLTQRQKDLIDYLKEDPYYFHTQKEVAENIEGYNYRNDIRNHLPELWKDIKAINEDEDTNCFIYYKNYRCKIADLPEIEKYCEWLYAKAIRILYRRKKILKKNGLQGKKYYNIDYLLLNGYADEYREIKDIDLYSDFKEHNEEFKFLNNIEELNKNDR